MKGKLKQSINLDVCRKCQMECNRINLEHSFNAKSADPSTPTLMTPMRIADGDCCWWSLHGEICGSILILDKNRINEFNDFIDKNIYDYTNGFRSCKNWKSALDKTVDALKRLTAEFPCRCEMEDEKQCPYLLEHVVLIGEKIYV